MAKGPIYVIGHKKMYLTNRTNAKRAWEVVEKVFGDQDGSLRQELEFAYLVHGNEAEYIRTPARYQKIKQLCLTSYRNRILVYPVGQFVDQLSIQHDIIGGRD